MAADTGTARGEGFSFGGHCETRSPVVLSIAVPNTRDRRTAEQIRLPGAPVILHASQVPRPKSDLAMCGGGDLETLKSLCTQAPCALDGEDVGTLRTMLTAPSLASDESDFCAGHFSYAPASASAGCGTFCSQISRRGYKYPVRDTALGTTPANGRDSSTMLSERLRGG